VRAKNRDHCAFVAALPCLICGRAGVHVAHVRYAEPRAGKPITGIGTKPSDVFTVPLCPEHHAQQHKGAERAFWSHHAIDPIFVALALYGASGNMEAGEQIVRHAYFHS
jgi:hypothetical protein